MEKFAYAIQMSFPVPDAEKRAAEKSSEAFNNLLGRLKLAVEHLELIYDPFKKIDQVDNQTIVEYRDVFRKYRDKVENNFQKSFQTAFLAVNLLSEFPNHTQDEILKSFMDQVDALDEQLVVFLSLFDNLNSIDFKNNLLASIDSIKKGVNKTRQIINDRILEYIDTNILAKNWMSDISSKYHNDVRDEVREKVPLVVELFRERQKALQNR